MSRGPKSAGLSRNRLRLTINSQNITSSSRPLPLVDSNLASCAALEASSIGTRSTRTTRLTV